VLVVKTLKGKQMVNSVIRFNKIRNEFKLDFKLERKMYMEEVREFFDATSLAQRIDGRIDTEYVYDGCEMKCLYNDVVNPFDVQYHRFTRMADSIIDKELRLIGLDFHLVMKEAKQIVCDANDIKGLLLTDEGKVSKVGYTVDATKQIQDMLDRMKG
jgi:hypothetical protein